MIGPPSILRVFLNSFHFNVSRKLTSNKQRFSYLLHYCRGVAKDAVRHCALLSEESCFETAVQILKTEFGQPYTIVQNLTKDLFESPPIKHDLAGLQALIRQIRGCSTTLRELNRSADLDSTVLLVKLAERLPKPIQTRWAETVESLISDCREPGFQDLLGLLEKRAAVMNSDFGRLAFGTGKTGLPRDVSRPHRIVVVKADNACGACTLAHPVHSCSKLLELANGERRQLVQEKGLCFKCL